MFIIPEQLVVALAELYKLVLSGVAMHREGKSVIKDIDWTRSYLFAAPGVLYAVNNNLQFFILRKIPPAILVVGNMKAVWYVCARRHILQHRTLRPRTTRPQ